MHWSRSWPFGPKVGRRIVHHCARKRSQRNDPQCCPCRDQLTCREMALLFQHHRIWSSAVKARCFRRYLLGRFSPQVALANSAGLPYPVITFPNSDWVRFKRAGRGNRGGGGPPPTMCGDYAGSSGDFCRRRRHQARRPPLAKMRPGTPAPTMGPGTSAKVPTPKAVDPLALRTRSP